jgi:Ras-related protein Rab-19
MQSTEPDHEDSFDFLFKIILVGDSDVGKTCVVQSFKSGIFAENQQNTIGVDFTVRTLDIDGKRIKVSNIICVYRYAHVYMNTRACPQ